MAETVKFATNLPVALELKFDTGLECRSQFNGADQVCYTLTDDRRMYVAPSLARKITDLGITRNVPFSICKREKIIGNRRTIDWEVTRTDTSSTDTSSIGTQAPEAAPHSVTVNAAPETASQMNGHSHTNGNGRGNGNGHPAVDDSLTVPLLNSLLITTGKAAIDAVLAIEAYGREKGMGTDFAFGPENIQKIWISQYLAARGK